MSSIISKTSLKKIESIRKYVLKAAIWILVGAVVVGVMAILFGGTSSGEIILKFMGTLFIVALMMMISVNNFKRIASEVAVIQIFALIGLCTNIIWAILWTIICWNPEFATYGCSGYSLFCKYEYSMMFKIAAAVSYLSALGFIGSNVMAIYEGEKSGMIKPLKITAVACATYEMLYCTITVFTGIDYMSETAARFGMLAGFTGFVWLVVLIVALVLSKSEKNKLRSADAINREAKDKQEVNAGTNKIPGQKTDAELRAEIEEKVRREMIEKEVRAEFESAQKQFESDSDAKSDSDFNSGSE